MKKKAKALKAARTSNKKIKPVKALTGLEIALISGAGSLLAGEMMKEKPKTVTPYDPFKKYDPAMTPAQYVAKSTSAGSVTGEALDPITSSGESASKSTTTGTGTTANEQDMPADLVKVKKGGMIRGQGAAIRGTKFKGIF
jgi:hypothetical protein